MTLTAGSLSRQPSRDMASPQMNGGTIEEDVENENEEDDEMLI